ncbi:MAG: sugar phosphate isomerase/epimerase family protein [Verrucomicrobiota bacterium]
MTTSSVLASGLLLAGQPFAHGAAKPAPWRVTCRDNLLATTGQPDCWAAMQFLGVDGVEVEVNEQLVCNSLKHPEKQYSLATEDGIKLVRDDFAKNGKVITSFCMHNRLDERLEQEVEWAGKLAQAAAKLGVGAIRIDVYPRKVAGEAMLPFAIKACKQLCEVAGDAPVRFGIENHGKFTNDPEVLEKLFAAVGSPKLALTLDSMNFYWFGHPLRDLYGILERFAGRTCHTHCKNLRYPEDKKNERRTMGWEYAKYSIALHEGDLDYARIAGILRKVGYAGNLCLENECLKHYPKEQHPEVLKKEIALLRSLV